MAAPWEYSVKLKERATRMAVEAHLTTRQGALERIADQLSVHPDTLNRGGDRQLNRAITTVIILRMGRDRRTRNYVARRTMADPSEAA